MKSQRQLYLDLIDETVAYYYDADLRPIPRRRSFDETKNECMYKHGDRRCAASRLLPDVGWVEGYSCDSSGNIKLAEKALASRGIYTIDENKVGIAHLLRLIQIIHDVPEEVEENIRTAKLHANYLSDEVAEDASKIT